MQSRWNASAGYTCLRLMPRGLKFGRCRLAGGGLGPRGHTAKADGPIFPISRPERRVDDRRFGDLRAELASASPSFAREADGHLLGQSPTVDGWQFGPVLCSWFRAIGQLLERLGGFPARPVDPEDNALLILGKSDALQSPLLVGQRLQPIAAPVDAAVHFPGAVDRRPFALRGTSVPAPVGLPPAGVDNSPDAQAEVAPPRAQRAPAEHRRWPPSPYLRTSPSHRSRGSPPAAHR